MKLHSKVYNLITNSCNVSRKSVIYKVLPLFPLYRYPYRIATLPLDLSTLTPEERAERDKAKQLKAARLYVEEEGLDEDGEWSQDKYRDL